jgi:hypothetical protein
MLALAPLTAMAQTIAWRGTVEIAAGAGELEPWRQNESRFDYVDDPTVAIDERGEIAVAWVDQARKDVLFQRLDAGGERQLREPANVSRSSATFSWLPRIALAPDDAHGIFVLWQEIIFSGGSHGGDILFARSDDGGRSFATSLNLSASRAGDGKGRISARTWHNGSLDLAAGADGLIYAAWTEYEGRLWLARSDDGGRSFAPRVWVAGDRRLPARGPSLALDEGGLVYLAWTVGEDRSADVRMASSSDGGRTFGTTRIIGRSAGYSDAPKVAVGPDGAVHLVYAESDGGPFGRYHIRYTQSAGRGRDFAPPRALTAPAPGSSASASFPGLGVDAEGGVYVLSELFYDDRRRARGLAFTFSSDGGRTFAAPLEVPDSADPDGGSNGSRQGLLMRKLAVNRAGAAAVVNSSLEDGVRSRVWLLPGRRAGR